MRQKSFFLLCRQLGSACLESALSKITRIHLQHHAVLATNVSTTKAENPFVRYNTAWSSRDTSKTNCPRARHWPVW